MVEQIIKRIQLNNNWIKVNLKDNESFYLIAIKEEMFKLDTVDPQCIKRICFEIGIDSGIAQKPLTIKYVNLNFEDITSGDNEINSITAFTKVFDLPNDFYIKIKSINDGKTDIIKDAQTSISVNINTL